MSADISTRDGLFAVMRQIAAEREAAKPLVAELMAREALPWDEEIPEEWRTVGFVEELGRAAGEKVEADPIGALTMLQMGVALLTAISSADYPASLSTHQAAKLWIDIAFTNRYTTSYEEALRACEVAESLAASANALSYELGVAKFQRAVCLGFVRSLEAALASLDECKRIFVGLGDKRRLIRCEIFTINVEHWRGNLKKAYEGYLTLLPLVADVDPGWTLGGVYNNLGATAVKLGKLDEAQAAFENAQRVHASIGAHTEVDRARWGLGLVALERGDHRSALSLLRDCRAGFLEREIIEDAGQVGLDIVDALVASGSLAEARALTQQVIDEFASANLSQNVMRAVAYLQSLSFDKPDTRRAIKHVRKFVADFRTSAEQLFIPPPDEID